MENLENKIEEVVTTIDSSGITKIKSTKKVELTSLEAQVIARSEDLNRPALCSMFEITHDELETILAKK
jgi:hypothetical protein